MEHGGIDRSIVLVVAVLKIPIDQRHAPAARLHPVVQLRLLKVSDCFNDLFNTELGKVTRFH